MRPELIMIAPENIEATAATQVRTRIHEEVVNLYTRDMEHGQPFPPVDVFAEEGSQRYILADGFHRHRAYINVGADEIPCHLYRGGMREALIHALGANETHGLRRSNADKRLAVKIALKDPYISQMSLREIADICRVSHTTVATIRNELTMQDEDIDPSDHNPDGEVPSDADEDDKAVKREATQAEVETRELQQACDLVKNLPYSGEDALDRLEITQDLIADLEYVGAWTADAVLHYHRRQRDEKA